MANNTLAEKAEKKRYWSTALVCALALIACGTIFVTTKADENIPSTVILLVISGLGFIVALFCGFWSLAKALGVETAENQFE